VEEKNYGVANEAPDAATRNVGNAAADNAARDFGGRPEAEAGPGPASGPGYDAAYGRSGYGSGSEHYGTGGRLYAAGSGVREENTWSVLAHLSVLLNIVTGFLGPVAALVMWLVYRDRSPRVAFHALQSMWYQIAWFVILAIGWTITTLLMAVLIGFLLVPVMLILTVVPFVHMGYAAYRVSSGEDYRYPLVADLIQNR
jgi:uncharacterized protein